MMFTLIFLGFFQLASTECTNMLFLEHNTYVKQISKTRSITVTPALEWKDYIIHNMQANEIFTKLDFDKYELMTHAYKGGLIIHRVCEKNSEYPKYGRITNTEMRGYVVDVRDMFITDMFLSDNYFTTYAHGHRKYNFIEYRNEQNKKRKEQELKEIEEYKKTNPIKHFIYYIIINKYCLYLFIIYVFRYLFS